ncbi:MAG: hypothetical protein JSR77_15125 [Planctomycetes bacterium]|nr:hypothetical protein [Planctomycetota bacterium]
MRLKARLAKLESCAAVKAAMSPAAVEERRRRALMEADPRYIAANARAGELLRSYPGFVYHKGPLFENLPPQGTTEREAVCAEQDRVSDQFLAVAEELIELEREFMWSEQAM